MSPALQQENSSGYKENLTALYFFLAWIHLVVRSWFDFSKISSWSIVCEVYKMILWAFRSYMKKNSNKRICTRRQIPSNLYILQIKKLIGKFMLPRDISSLCNMNFSLQVLSADKFCLEWRCMSDCIAHHAFNFVLYGWLTCWTYWLESYPNIDW